MSHWSQKLQNKCTNYLKTRKIFTHLELLNERASEMIQLWNTSLIEFKKKSKYHAKSHSVFWYSYLLIFIASFTMRTLIMDVDFCLHSAIIVCADIYFNPLKIGASKIKKEEIRDTYKAKLRRKHNTLHMNK